FNGIDDDSDGYIDNWHGWDVIGNGTAAHFHPDNDPIPDTKDTSSHGTLTAGCACATVNNGIGVAGTGYKCKYLPIKIDNATNGFIAPGVFEGFHYASTHGAKVISCSWSFGYDSSASSLGKTFLDEAAMHGCLVIE